MRIFEIQMLNNLVQLKRYKINNRDYYKVSDFLKTFDNEQSDNKLIIDGLKRLSHDCFTTDMKYVSTQAIADLLMF